MSIRAKLKTVHSLFSFSNLIFMGLFLTIKSVAAENSNQFEYLDSNISLNAGLGLSGNYFNIVGGLNSSILAHNIWGEISVNGLTNIETNGLPIVQPYRIATELAILGKIGFSLTFADSVNIIPYIGAGYNNSTMLFHTNSQPIFNNSSTNIDMMVGIKPELAFRRFIKLSLDTNITNEQQQLVVPNSLTTLAHQGIQNYYLITTPAIQLNPFAKFNIEAYYQYVMPQSNNQISYNVINQGYSSASLINSMLGPQNTIGLKIGILF